MKTIGHAVKLDMHWGPKVTELYPACRVIAETCQRVFEGHICTRAKHDKGPHVAHRADGTAVALLWDIRRGR